MSKKYYKVESALPHIGEAEEAVELIAQFISEKKSEGWTDLFLSINGIDDYNDGALVLVGNRPESAAEENKRLKLQEKNQERAKKTKAKMVKQFEENELKELARLKAKYESKK